MQAVVLAAGASSRFWPLNQRHKSLMEIAGRSLLERTLDGLAEAGITDIVVVQGPDGTVAHATETPDSCDLTYVVQEDARGMGDAVEQARDHISDRFIVTSPYRIEIGELVVTLQAAAEGNDGAVLGVETDHPERYGILNINGERATGIVEKPATDEAPSPYKVRSTYLLDPTFFDYLNAVETHEYHFEDALDRYMDERAVGFAELDDAYPSLKYPWDLFGFRDRILARQEPRVAGTADVADSAVIDGNVVVAAGATVYEHAVVRGPAYIGENATVGNGAVVRAGTCVEQDGTIGAHAEIRGSLLQRGFSCHSGFIGDSIVGRDVAVGAGTVVANRRVRDADGERPDIAVHVRTQDESVDTGLDRLGVIVGDGVDIGTQANLMPGVCIGSDSFIGPSALVRHNIGDGKTYFSKQEGREIERR